MGLLEAINKLISEHGSASILRERLEFLGEQAQALEKKVAELEAENAKLKKCVSHLESELATKTWTEEFVEHRGALFKRKPGGGYHLAVYCPTCKKSCSSNHTLPYDCSCGWSADFAGWQLQSVINELS